MDFIVAVPKGDAMTVKQSQIGGCVVVVIAIPVMNFEVVF
jgi:hypothetical protein